MALRNRCRSLSSEVSLSKQRTPVSKPDRHSTPASHHSKSSSTGKPPRSSSAGRIAQQASAGRHVDDDVNQVHEMLHHQSACQLGASRVLHEQTVEVHRRCRDSTPRLTSATEKSGSRCRATAVMTCDTDVFCSRRSWCGSVGGVCRLLMASHTHTCAHGRTRVTKRSSMRGWSLVPMWEYCSCHIRAPMSRSSSTESLLAKAATFV